MAQRGPTCRAYEERLHSRRCKLDWSVGRKLETPQLVQAIILGRSHHLLRLPHPFQRLDHISRNNQHYGQVVNAHDLLPFERFHPCLDVPSRLFRHPRRIQLQHVYG